MPGHFCTFHYTTLLEENVFLCIKPIVIVAQLLLRARAWAHTCALIDPEQACWPGHVGSSGVERDFLEGLSAEVFDCVRLSLCMCA